MRFHPPPFSPCALLPSLPAVLLAAAVMMLLPWPLAAHAQTASTHANSSHPLPAGARSITLSEAKLNEALATRFPMQRSLQGLMQLRLHQPHIALLPALEQLQTTLQLQVSEPFTGSRYDGQVRLQHRLRYEASDRSLRLSDITMGELDFPSAPEPYRNLLQQHAPQLMAQVLPELPLYTAKPEDTALIDGLGFTIGNLDVTSKGLRVVLLPPSLPNAGQ